MIKYAMISNIGSREINEDAVGAFEKNGRYGFILCDGLGGHGMGDEASVCVVKAFQEKFQQADDMSSFLSQTFDECQKELLTRQTERHAKQKMKTTAVALVTDSKRAYIGHVGDSRLYLFRKNKILTRTIDHSIPQMLVLSKQIKENEIRKHPDRNILLRVMGTDWDEPKYELMSPVNLKKCQAFLLCSDGFWEYIEEETMCELLKKAASPDDWLTEMEYVVKANGMGEKMDNYSAIAVWNID